VLEIREELDKAEQELTGLKKQWATYEGRKKREEVVRVRRGAPVALGDVPQRKQVEDLDIQEEERRRRRVLVELSGNAAGSGSQTSGGGGMARKGSQRKVFEGRHTRTLSLLSPTAVRRRSDEEDFGGSIVSELQEGQASGEEQNAQDGIEAGTATRTLETPHHLSRLPTLDGFVSPDAISATSATTPTFGKTYKELVAAQQRRSLPPATVEMMKQGRAVVEGMRDGLWTFFEDIRQATVGDEAVYGPTSAEQQARLEGRWVPKKNGRNAAGRSRGTSTSPERKAVASATTEGKKDGMVKSANGGNKENSFWREFGLDTPGRAPQDAAPSRAVNRTNDAGNLSRQLPGGAADVKNTIKGHRAHTPNDSNGSSSTPELSSDSPSGASSEAASKEDDADLEHWDTWDASPLLARRHDSLVEETAVNKAVVDGEDLPWPELKKPKDTPTKLARTGSDFIRGMEG
jgi:hypothetical protein